MHQPAYALFDLLQLMGVQATAAGYRIVPHLPMTTFNVRLPSVGLAQQSNTIRGYFRAVASATTTIEVKPPPGVSVSSAVTWVNGSVVPHTVDGGLVSFSLPLKAGQATDWAVTG